MDTIEGPGQTLSCGHLVLCAQVWVGLGTSSVQGEAYGGSLTRPAGLPEMTGSPLHADGHVHN